MHVTNLETCTLTRQTARTKSRKTTFMSNLSQRVRLVHELGQRVSSEERIDNARNSFGVNQIGRSKHFVVANIHAFTDRSAHTGQTDGKLVGKLLAYRADTTVAQMVDIVDSGL